MTFERGGGNGSILLLGVDDTDDLDGPGTGRRARDLAAELASAGLAVPLGVTRHQLLVSPEIPYTSHNSSACLTLLADLGLRDEIREAAESFLVAGCAAVADVGLCLAGLEQAKEVVAAWGRRAKREVLTQDEAHEVARAAGVELRGLTGTRGGVIGALAAVGLRARGGDGRFLWLAGLREATGSMTVGDLIRTAGIDEVRGPDGAKLPDRELVDTGEWLRPLLLDGKAILPVEEAGDGTAHGWRVLPRDRIKALSS